jgi:aminopeptidase N
VVAHEVGHQWFYNVVGSNQQSEPWVDESLVQYITEQYFVAMYGDSAGDGLKANWYARWERAEKEEIPIGLEADDYESTAYSAIVYGRGPLFYLELENQLGRDTLLKGISDYYLQNQWQLTHTEDVRASLESACGCDLTDMFEEWVYPEN